MKALVYLQGGALLEVSISETQMGEILEGHNVVLPSGDGQRRIWIAATKVAAIVTGRNEDV
ncbi:MAG TPA: hypothetical protein PLD73_01365 [Candidatus Hydrogenedentes bacterium]|nr:hypothetical protein [Candidatus Hydrogenedentota bacterium]